MNMVTPGQTRYMKSAVHNPGLTGQVGRQLCLALALAVLILLWLFPLQESSAQSYFSSIQENMGKQAGGGGTTTAPRRLTGFTGVAWETSFTEVKKHIKNLILNAEAGEKVEILMEKRNEYILVKRNDVLYRYNFYKTPIEIRRITEHGITREDWDEEEAKLYHVKTTMPLIDSARVKERLIKVYGRNTKSTVNDQMVGADIYEAGPGLVFQWYEPYNKIPFTRNIDYLSLEMSKKIMKEYEMYFDARERYILKKLLIR